MPPKPKLRNLEPQWVRLRGERRLWLRDPLRLTETATLVPVWLVPLLPALDGTADLPALARRFARETGVEVPREAIERVLAELDEALVLESPRLQHALDVAATAYRRLPSRAPSLAGRSYPAAPVLLDALFSRLAGGAAGPEPMRPITVASGVLSPHIDYQRGGGLYARTWQPVLPAVASAEVIVVFGTDHHGSPGRLTLTAQHYATPWGALQTDVDAVRRLETSLGGEWALAEELHHRDEHSIELAAVWLHWALRRAGRRTLPPLIPVLCGSFHCFVRPPARGREGPATVKTPGPRRVRVDGAALPEAGPPLADALAALHEAIAGRRALVVSAADLAHVGPAFGDAEPLASPAKAALAAADAALLEHLAAGDATALLQYLRAEGDRRRICGLPPTYWALRLLERLNGGKTPGRLAGYDQCPADEAGGSVVSIAGMLWEPAPLRSAGATAR